MKFEDSAGVRKVFDLSSPTQMFEKLCWENDQIKSMLALDDPKVIFAAFNAAATAWHLIEWITTFARVHPLEDKLDIDIKNYRDDAVARCPELAICQQLSVGWKHRITERPNHPDVQALHVLDLYVKTEGGLPVDGASPTRWHRRPAIYGKKSIDLDAFFDIVTHFWSAELDRLKFSRTFTV